MRLVVILSYLAFFLKKKGNLLVHKKGAAKVYCIWDTNLNNSHQNNLELKKKSQSKKKKIFWYHLWVLV